MVDLSRLLQQVLDDAIRLPEMTPPSETCAQEGMSMAENAKKPWNSGVNWRVMLLLAFLWLILLTVFAPRMRANTINLSYSDFKHQVAQGNVAEITVQGDTVRGVFRDGYRVGSEDREHTYTHFSTVLPSFQDPELLKLLEQHKVRIQAEPAKPSWLGPLLLTVMTFAQVVARLAESPIVCNSCGEASRRPRSTTRSRRTASA